MVIESTVDAVINNTNWGELLGTVRRIARARLRNCDDGDDCAGQVLLNVFSAIREGHFTDRGSGSLERFASKSAANLARNHVRNNAYRERWVHANPEAIIGPNSDLPTIDDYYIDAHTLRKEPKPEQLAICHETGDFLKRIIAGLVPIERQIVILRYEGLTYREISEELGITEDTIKSRLWRLRRRLEGIVNPLDLQF